MTSKGLPALGVGVLFFVTCALAGWALITFVEALGTNH